jgi:CMP-N-acetylneuraminic acid synthetase
MKYLGVIPARGGSKGVHKKNIKNICGKPLIYWSIKAASDSQAISDFLISTEDQEIAKVAQSFEASVDIRPQHLSRDQATTISVIQDLAKRLPDVENFIVLQPTSPLRTGALIDQCINQFEKGSYNTLATGFYCKCQEYGSHNNDRRQDHKGFFYDDGNIYILNKKHVLNELWFGEKIRKFAIDKQYNFEIDDTVDFVVLEALMNKYLLKEE